MFLHFPRRHKAANVAFGNTLPLTLLLACLYFFCSGISCAKKDSENNITLPFDSIPVAHAVKPIIDEGSGIADSKVNPGNIWVEEDSGNPPEIILVKHDGTLIRKVFIKNATNRDWEDMALYNDSIYVAEIGDNDALYDTYSFYIFPEPSSSVDTVSSFRKISFKYPDGSHDAEAFLMDRSTGNIFIITKRDSPSRIYKLKYPFADSANTLEYAGKLNYNEVTSAAISSDDKEVMVKTYTEIKYYTRNPRQDIITCLSQTPIQLPYTLEPQGEAVCFSPDSSGFYTLSEKSLSSVMNLYFYPRR